MWLCVCMCVCVFEIGQRWCGQMKERERETVCLCGWMCVCVCVCLCVSVSVDECLCELFPVKKKWESIVIWSRHQSPITYSHEVKTRLIRTCFKDWARWFFYLLSAFLRNWFLCWDRWNGDVMPTLDAAPLCSSRAGSDLGHESELVWGALSIGSGKVYVLDFMSTYIVLFTWSF